MKNIFEILTDAGIEIPEDKKATITTAVNENYKTIAEVEKIKTARDDYKSRLDTATKSLKDFEGVDVEDLQGKIKTLETDLANKDAEYQQKIADRDFSDKLNGLITKAGGRNATSIIANLDINALKSSKNQDVDMQSAIDAFKEKEGYMFGANEPYQNPVAPTNGGGGNSSITAETFAKMGYNQRTKIFNENPTLYKQLSGKE